jgi:hypothetical protein
VGLVLAALAVYAAFALELEDAAHRTILPVLRHGQGAEALTGGLDSQLAGLGREPGVRPQL